MNKIFKSLTMLAVIALFVVACAAAATQQPIATLASATEEVPTATEIAPTNTLEPAPTTSATEVPVSPLVGTWQRVNSCASFVQAFKEAGLIDLAPES